MSPALALLCIAASAAAPDSSLAIPGYELHVERVGAVVVRAFGVRELNVPPGSPTLSPRAADRAARALLRFLFDHPKVFGLDPETDALSIIATARVGDHSWIQFSQSHRGRAVVTDACDGLVDADGRVEQLLTDFAVLAPDPGPMLSADDAIAIASRLHPPARGVAPWAETPRYCLFGDVWHLVHVVQLPRPAALGRRVIVDAFTGAVLSDIQLVPSDPR